MLIIYYIKILIIKVNKNYQNYQMQMMLLKPVLCFMQQQQEVVETQQIQPNGEQLSIVTGDECVGQAWWNYVYVNTVPVYIYKVHTGKFFFIIKVYFPNLDWVGGS
jgi:hypothetical protein